ncbi:hypothetical protein [Cyclobacterium jeungdonense]|uniref:Uncharacterized protein n=1 Tax=Cyclobacterium jeungdonense TaxID=708087 RepID=A0ABT8CC72_9BACT|nr:hypothetical protein [Cyclobacterium jeungdonense]MDN3689549.1 hypothetical protein [Cyclobacterium jeungdonense]
MKSITIDIINEKAILLLQDLELLKLIRMRKETAVQKDGTDWGRYKGVMSKQPIGEVDQQLNELRSEWE